MSAFDRLREALGVVPHDPPEIHWRAPREPTMFDLMLEGMRSQRQVLVDLGFIREEQTNG